MMLSNNFSIKELIKSQTAERRDINNNPGADEIHNMKILAEKILQPVRDHYKIPFTVSSGYRCPELSIIIGSSKKSQHCKGQAADFEVPGVSNWDLCHYIKDNLELVENISRFELEIAPNEPKMLPFSVDISMIGEVSFVEDQLRPLLRCAY